ncbi:uncharacterized protein LOC128502675 isoform X2 [Spea bombifrons]|uniref:uncharacterized protein LOC128502675 isoform X2 n=1 Tax=Spea bombifrons TaxID=233779 RepID=UPI00234BDAB9|nr:uncharacterized protein LOC128502675 isoform X2 [Spea bombifrons]
MLLTLILVLSIPACCGTEGCSSHQSPPPSLDLVLNDAANALICSLCQTKALPKKKVTFSWSLNGVILRSKKESLPNAIYNLDPAKPRNHGRWRCSVAEFPQISAEYLLTPSQAAQPGETDNSERASSGVTQTVVISVTVTVVILIVLIVTGTASACYAMELSRTESVRQRRAEDKKTSSEEDLRSRALSEEIKGDSDNVSYVELQLHQKPRPPLPRNTCGTVYASIM